MRCKMNAIAKLKGQLIKNAMELSKNCNLDVYLCVIERDNLEPKVEQYASFRGLLQEVRSMLNDHEMYTMGPVWTNDDYNKKFQVTDSILETSSAYD